MEPDGEADQGLLRGHPDSVLGRRQVLRAYGITVVHVEASRAGGISWKTLEEKGDRVRRRRYASGPGGYGYWERVTDPDGRGMWRRIREEFYLPWRGPAYALIHVERAVYAELWQEWGAW